jgi:enoyl-CoA hydratase
METLELELAGKVAIVRLNRPPVNAVNRTMTRELRACFDELSQNREVAAVVLSSALEKIFCAGIDMNDVAAGESLSGAGDDTDVHQVLDSHREWRQAQNAIYWCTVPVIAAVERTTIGSGFGLIGVCDLVIAGEEATFGLTEINVGLLGGASKALRLFGPSKARRMLFLGEMQTAQELHRLGGIEELVPAGTAEPRAIELAQMLAEKSPIALRLAKESILRIEADEVMTMYRTENDYTNRLRTYEDSKEAIRAFVEKRPPKWTWT